MSMMHQSLIHKLKIATIGNRLISGGASSLLRRLSTAPEIYDNVDNHTLSTAPKINPAKNRVDQHQLYKMIIANEVKSSDTVSDLLQRLANEDKQLLNTDLVECVKKLRKSHRYQQCLEILDWMEKGTMNSSKRDYALRLGIIWKLKGIDEAERYFDSLSPAMKSRSTYGALLHCYCTEKMTDKALALFEKMDEMNRASNSLAFNNLMDLYIKVGQPEKVPPLVQEMKKRNIPLTNFSYYIWIQSCGSLGDLEGLERVVDEVEQQKRVRNDRTIYSNLVAVYVEVGQFEKAEAALKKMEEVLDHAHKPDLGAYHNLISSCASTGSLEFVTRVWNKLKSKLEVCDNNSYLAMLLALSKLDDIEGMKLCLKEWESRYQSYDVRLPFLAINAYLKKDMVEEAELLLKDAEDRAGQKIQIAHISLANYYLRKRQVDSALRHLELGIDNNKGKPLKQSIHWFFEYYKEERDVDGAEELCRIIKKARPLDSKVYLQLLWTYEAAEKTAPEMRQRMEKDGVDIGTEYEELLEKVCPN